MEEGIAHEIAWNVGVGADMVHRDQPAVHRVRPDVVRASRWRDDGNGDERRRREPDATWCESCAGLREEQRTEAAEGNGGHDDATSGTDDLEADELGQARADQHRE